MMMQTFQKFLKDDKAWDMYITGRAGTGKTTGLAELIEHCHTAKLPYVVCAYTHKACGVLQSKLPQGAMVQTLHKFLKKRPGVNTEATRREAVDTNLKMGDSEKVHLLFIDEYSMIGEKDFADIGAMQDETDDGKPTLKVIWIGDPYQLPPVRDAQAVRPYGKYQVMLKTIHRQGKDNPLLDVLSKLVSFIEGAKPTALESSTAFVRGKCLATAYEECTHEDKVLLAYTNRRVQQLNAEIAGKFAPEEDDQLFSPTNKQSYTFIGLADKPVCISSPFEQSKLLDHYDKYNTLSVVHDLPGVQFADIANEDGDEITAAFVFGHYDYKVIADQLKSAAAASNAAIQRQTAQRPAEWCKANRGHPLERTRAKAWQQFLAFNEWVMCLDFPHAQTVHKSQGSTYKTVFVDTQDIGLAADMDYSMYLRLLYVAISRASDSVITN